MPTGYCTVDDVRRALRSANLPGDAAQDSDIVVDAIVGQTEWLQEWTNRHWFVSGGISEDDDDLIPTSTKTRQDEEQDIPSTPHAGPGQMQVPASRQARYPLRNNDPFTRIKLDKQYAQTLSAVKVKDASGSFTDWTASNDYAQGEDYRLYVDAGSTSSPSYVDLRARVLPRLRNYDTAVRVSYDYGLDELPRTVRRAVALKAAAQLLTDDEAAMAIPDDGQLTSAETKVQAMERQAEELLEAYA